MSAKRWKPVVRTCTALRNTPASHDDSVPLSLSLSLYPYPPPPSCFSFPAARCNPSLTLPLGLARTAPSSEGLATGVGLNISGLGLPQRRTPSSPTLLEPLLPPPPPPPPPGLLRLSGPSGSPVAPPGFTAVERVAIAAAAAEAEAAAATLPSASGLSRHQVSGRRSCAATASPVNVWQVSSCALHFDHVFYYRSGGFEFFSCAVSLALRRSLVRRAHVEWDICTQGGGSVRPLSFVPIYCSFICHRVFFFFPWGKSCLALFYPLLLLGRLFSRSDREERWCVAHCLRRIKIALFKVKDYSNLRGVFTSEHVSKTTYSRQQQVLFAAALRSSCSQHTSTPNHTFSRRLTDCPPRTRGRSSPPARRLLAPPPPLSPSPAGEPSSFGSPSTRSTACPRPPDTKPPPPCFLALRPVYVRALLSHPLHLLGRRCR